MKIVDGKEVYGFSDEELVELPTVYRDDLFKDKVILVSGAGSGFGKAIAYLFARLGATLVICGRDQAKLDHSADWLGTIGAAADTHSMTIRDADQVDAMMGEVFDKHGRLDVLVNNAGGQFPQTGHRLHGEGVERGHRHQSERHLVYDAGGRETLVRPRSKRRHRQHRRRYLARSAGHGAYHGGTGRRYLRQQNRRRGMGPEGHPRQLRGARLLRIRRLQTATHPKGRPASMSPIRCCEPETSWILRNLSSICPRHRQNSSPAK